MWYTDGGKVKKLSRANHALTRPVPLSFVSRLLRVRAYVPDCTASNLRLRARRELGQENGTFATAHCGVFAIIVLCNLVLCNLMSLYACCTRAGEHV